MKIMLMALVLLACIAGDSLAQKPKAKTKTPPKPAPAVKEPEVIREPVEVPDVDKKNITAMVKLHPIFIAPEKWEMKSIEASTEVKQTIDGNKKQVICSDLGGKMLLIVECVEDFPVILKGEFVDFVGVFCMDYPPRDVWAIRDKNTKMQWLKKATIAD